MHSARWGSHLTHTAFSLVSECGTQIFKPSKPSPGVVNEEMNVLLSHVVSDSCFALEEEARTLHGPWSHQGPHSHKDRWQGGCYVCPPLAKGPSCSDAMWEQWTETHPGIFCSRVGLLFSVFFCLSPQSQPTPWCCCPWRWGSDQLGMSGSLSMHPLCSIRAPPPHSPLCLVCQTFLTVTCSHLRRLAKMKEWSHVGTSLGTSGADFCLICTSPTPWCPQRQ